MKTRSQSRKSGGFTLIELLVVITLILLLIGMVFGGISAAMRQARIYKAQTMVNNLEAAFRQYFNEYGKWPSSSPATLTVDADMTKLLEGDPSSSLPNPRNIVFMQVSSSVKDASGALVGPGGAGTSYMCMFDVQGLNQLTRPDTNITERTGVLVWGINPFVTNPSDSSYYVGSWK